MNKTKQMPPVPCSFSKMMPTGDLVPNPRNPNTHPDSQIELLAKIIDFQGWRLPIVVSKQSGFVVRGHGRLLAARKLGMEMVPVDEQDYESEAQEWADLVADNRIAELAEMDRASLKDIIETLDTGEIDMELTGFTESELEDLMSEFFVPEEGNTDADELPDQVEARTKEGDLWQLGKHRLLCADCTKAGNVDKVLGGETPALMLTDPPYGIKQDKGFAGARGFGGKGKPIKSRQYNDEWDQERPSPETFSSLLPIALQSIIFGGNYFADILPQSTHWLVWDKQNTMPTFSDCELVWTNLTRKSVRKYDFLYNGLIGKEKVRFHPTQKPEGILALLIADYSESAETIFDPFLGSGTTLIAAQRMDRTCYGMEIDPHYCDVAIQRWEDFTGEKAKKVNKAND